MQLITSSQKLCRCIARFLPISLIKTASYFVKYCYDNAALIYYYQIIKYKFLVGFVLLILQFYVYVLWIVVCPFVLFLLAIVFVCSSIDVFLLPLWYLQALLCENTANLTTNNNMKNGSLSRMISLNFPKGKKDDFYTFTPENIYPRKG